VVNFSRTQSATVVPNAVMANKVHPIRPNNRLSHLRDIVKACVFHRIKDMRQGVDDLQVNVVVASPLYDLQDEYCDIRALVDEAIADAVAFLPEVCPDDAANKAVIEGAIAGIEMTKRQAILKAQAEIQKIQAYIDDQEAELRSINDSIAAHLHNSSLRTSSYMTAQSGRRD
jgi:hypothetical protein